MTKEEFLPMLQEQRSSGLTVVEYCQLQSLSPSTFNYWKQKYNVTSGSRSAITTGVKPSNLVPVQIHKTASCSTNHHSGVLIQLPNGVQVEFTDSNDSVALQMLTTICSRYV